MLNKGAKHMDFDIFNPELKQFTPVMHSISGITKFMISLGMPMYANVYIFLKISTFLIIETFLLSHKFCSFLEYSLILVVNLTGPGIN